MENKFLSIAFLSAALAVGLGAFGAHGLQPLIDSKALSTYQTSVQYHFYHSIAIAVCGILHWIKPQKLLKFSGGLFLIGLILFSGSLYTMVFLKAAHFESVNWIGAITPFGGLCFISGWICLFFYALKHFKQD
jgi:uncharacterized membrane protein YgdD (TMEM256/DUF423 family)